MERSGAPRSVDETPVRSQNLSVDESVLTGESFPVEKAVGAETFAGTLVVRGKAYLEVIRTGPESAMGRLATMLGRVEAQRTPLELRLEVFGHRVARWILALALIGTAGLLVEGPERFGHVFLFAVALAVAAVPEGLPAVLTVTLALGVERMAKRNAVVRRLAAVEALGSVTVIATDKTGTLTENRMDVKDVDSPDEERALRAMVLANEAELEMAAGDPLEIALLRYADARGADPEGIRATFSRFSTRAFDSAWKFMRVTGTEQGRPLSYLKGAPEVMSYGARHAVYEGLGRSGRTRSGQALVHHPGWLEDAPPATGGDVRARSAQRAFELYVQRCSSPATISTTGFRPSGRSWAVSVCS